jgi:hypothetical protein
VVEVVGVFNRKVGCENDYGGRKDGVISYETALLVSNMPIMLQ